MDDYSLPLSLTSHLLIAPLGVDCKFAVPNNNNKKKNYCRTSGIKLHFLHLFPKKGLGM